MLLATLSSAAAKTPLFKGVGQGVAQGVAGALPDPEPLEEVAPAAPRDLPAALAFALSRALKGPAARPVVFVATQAWLNEHGRPFGWGFAGLGLSHDRLILVKAAREAEVLWALEETLKSGAVAAGLAPAAAPAFVATRRLDFAARAGQARALLLRPGPAADLSAARLRWRVGSAPSAIHPMDPRAPGPARLKVELVRGRAGLGGVFMLEQDHETHCFGLAAELADYGLSAGQMRIAAA
jgi:protein ImuA